MDRIAWMVAASAHLRGGRPFDELAHQHKEWMHFCVVSAEVELLINLSVVARPGPTAGSTELLPRVTLVASDRCGRDGDVESVPIDLCDLRPRRIDARFGASVLRHIDGEFHLDVKLQSRPVSARIRLRPITAPLLRVDTPAGDGTIHWFVVPHLRATGEVCLAGRRHELDDAPAYHDHNWGRWRWGNEFAWQWGFGLPLDRTSPWSFVLSRLHDRARLRDFGCTLVLWNGAFQQRVFRESEIELRVSGLLGARSLFKLPRIMSLVCPEQVTDVPRRVEVFARAGDDEVVGRFDAEDLMAQFLVPSEVDLGVLAINEVRGRCTLEGWLAGERMRMDGRAIFEFLTAG